MNAKAPLVSVVIPVFNGEDFVGRAIQSVLEQDYPHFEIIVADDGSTDGTGQVVRAIEGPITYLQQENRGPAAARNLGIDASAGDFIAFLDSDDEWLPGRLASCLQPMLRNPAVGMTYCRALLKKQDGTWGVFNQEFKRYRTFPPLLWPDPLQHTSATTCRRSVLDEAGRFEASLVAHEDQDFWIRMSEIADVAAIEDTLVRLHTRVQSLSRTTNIEEVGNCRRRVIERALDRHPEEYEPHRRTIMAEYYLSMGICAYSLKDFRRSRRFVRQSLKLIPTSRGLALMLQSLVPDPAMSRLRRMRDRWSRY